MEIPHDNVGAPLVATETTAITTSNRKYPRAKFHDYNGGLYFITVCTKNKKHYFGEIRNSQMNLSPTGVELQYQLENIVTHYNHVEIPLFVIMPNHFHAIIAVRSPIVATSAKIADNLGRLNKLARLTVATSGDPTLTTHHGCCLGNIISAVKAAVTRFARRNNIEFNWQSRYHDHIIRGNRDGNLIEEYIENNVAHWTDDCFYGE